MKKFEYKEMTYYNSNFDLIATLNDIGNYGWQVVSLTTIMFKDRPDLINRYDVVLMKEKTD